MAKFEKLKSVHIDVERDIYEINGRDISASGKFLSLTFENGKWSLMISEDVIYNISDQDVTE